MRGWHSVGVSLAAALGITVTALSQTSPQAKSTASSPGRTVEAKPAVPAALVSLPNDPRILVTPPLTPALQPGVPSETAAPEPEQRPEEGGEEEKWGPTMPEDVKLIMDNTAFGRMLECRGWRTYGWLDMGYTYASTKAGLLSVETRENRFGREFLFNQAALVLEKPLKQEDELNFGFKSLFYGGADAALLRPRGGFNTTDPRFGVDFRELYVSAHLPVLFEKGVDLRVGRMGTIIGYESAMAPYRPFYSNDYQWFYSQDGAWTGALANFHVDDQLDVLAGITMGANTFFTLRGNGPCYIGQVNYWTSEDKKTLLSASVHFGNQAIFTAPNFQTGDFITMVELRLQHDFNKYFTLILQSDDGWETNMPQVGTGEWYSAYAIGVAHLSKTVDLNLRGEWFHDVQGTRTGFARVYSEATIGLDWHPTKYLRIRPEVRGDWANGPAFGDANRNHQLTAAIEALIQF